MNQKFPQEQNCGNCHFFNENGNSSTQTIGYCRANPPTPYFENDENGIMVPRIGRFPVVLDKMWCGAWDLNEKLIEEWNRNEDLKCVQKTKNAPAQ